MEIRLKKLHIQNFKGCKDRVVEFGDNTKISGANATGKTTIFNAFTWLLFGKDSLGNAKFDIRPLDKDGKMIDNLEICVEAVLSVDDEEYSLKKVQKQKWVKKRGTNTTEFQGNVNEFEINGYPKSEKDFKEFISSMIDEKIFNLVTNPIAFTSLPWKEQREMLMKFVGDFSDVQIAEAYGEKFSKLIPELKIASTDDILKKYTKAKNTLNKEMIELPARIDEVSKQLVIVDVGALEVEKAAKEVALKKVEDELSGGTAKLEEINQKRQIVMELKFQASEVQNRETDVLMSRRGAAAERFNLKNQELMLARNNISNIIYEIETARKNMERAESDKQKYTEEWRKAKYSEYPAMKPFPDYEPIPKLTEKDLTCLTCGQSLPAEVREQRINDYENRKKKSEEGYARAKEQYEERYIKEKEKFLKTREANIQSATEKGQKAYDDVRLYQREIEEKQKVLGKLNADLKVAEEELQKEKITLDAIPTVANMDSNEEYQNILKQIDVVEAEIVEVSKVSSGNVELEAQKAVLKDEISEIELKIKSSDNTKVNLRIAELEEEKKEVGQKIAEQEQMIALTEDFIRTKMNRISSVINEKFRIVSFKLFDNQINGGLKECCECTVNGVPYSSLNEGHQLVAGFDIINSISNLYGVKTVVFLDKAERINDFNIPKIDTQLVTLKVTDDRELRVEV